MTVNNRDCTRFDFEPQKWVKVLRPNQALETFRMYVLLDVSKGGLSFVINKVGEFKRNDLFYFLEVEGRVLKDPLIVKVKYVRAMDKFGIDFKVGSEFVQKAIDKN